MELFKISVEPLEPFLEDKSSLTKFFTLNQFFLIGEYLDKIHKSDLTGFEVKTQKVQSVTCEEMKKIVHYILFNAKEFVASGEPVEPYDIVTICRFISLLCENKKEVSEVREDVFKLSGGFEGGKFDRYLEVLFLLLWVCSECDLKSVYSQIKKDGLFKEYQKFFEIYFTNLKL